MPKKDSDAQNNTFLQELEEITKKLEKQENQKFGIGKTKNNDFENNDFSKRRAQTLQTDPNQSFLVVIVLFVLLIALVLIFFLDSKTFGQMLPNWMTNSEQSDANEAKASKTVRKVKNAKNETVEVEKIAKSTDGDTVSLQDGRKIRYLNVDTPETVKVGVAVQCGGKEASDYTKKMMTEGRQIWLTQDKEGQDRYGRDLRFVFLKEEDTTDVLKSVNADLVRKGYGRARFYAPNTTYKKEFLALEEEAKKTEKGVWKCPKPFEE